MHILNIATTKPPNKPLKQFNSQPPKKPKAKSFKTHKIKSYNQLRVITQRNTI